SPHGTAVAGIIGALTNGPSGCSISGGIAGIAGGWNTENNLGCALYGLKTGRETGGQVNELVISAVLEGSAHYKDVENNIHRAFKLDVINISSGDSIYTEAERAAYNFAFEQGVSIVCSRGNAGSTKPNYPACLDPNWVISVGGHNDGDPARNILPQRWSGSSYGLGMDLLAPAYSQDIITTSYKSDEDKIDYYEKIGMTSMAAAHVTGVIALLRSEFFENPNHSVPPGIKPEPEDYENMLKAAALDLNYDPNNQNQSIKTNVGYDNVSGWGQLKAGKLFEMLADGYVLKHYKITQFQPENSFQQIPGGIAIHERQGLRGDIEPGNYPVAEIRTLTGTITLEDNWYRNETTKLYVWGRNGRTTKGGLSQGNPLFPTSFTEVTNGEGGNGLVPGIIHNNSLTVNAKTYQYRLNGGIIRPLDNNIELYISVFGKEIVQTGVDDYSANSNSFIFPNPSIGFVTLKLNLETPCSPIIRIINNLGVVLYEEKCDFMNSGNYDKIINTSDLISGVYFIEVYQNNKVIRNKLLITK
ncbi:MAG: S8 family serine peptidase, partial [Candidatus Kapabacteria bacterium]|nr:S8 family serine peptidase [Candidatus Kapabacteria bacterium]